MVGGYRYPARLWTPTGTDPCNKVTWPCSSPRQPCRVRISVLTGFLGNGKTTLLAGMLAIPGVKDTAVIVNECDAVGLDRLLREPQIRRSYRYPSGCACCASRRNAITVYLAGGRGAICRPFRHLMFETSGLAEPSPMREGLTPSRVAAEPHVGR